MKDRKQTGRLATINHVYVLAALTLVLAGPAQGADPVLIGQWPGWPREPVQNVAVSGNYAYVATGQAGLLVIDVSDPANPQRVGGCDTNGPASAVAVSGGNAYAATGQAGLQVIDVSDPAHPQRVGGYDTSGFAYGVAVSGNYAYVADGPAGLQVIDVSDPAHPRRMGGYNTSGSAYGVAVSGNYAYVADGDWGLAVFNLPSAPHLLITSIIHTSGTATVYYTHTIPGTAYTLEYCTDLSMANWQPVGTQTAAGSIAVQTDPAAGDAQRYYRVSYQP